MEGREVVTPQCWNHSHVPKLESIALTFDCLWRLFKKIIWFPDNKGSTLEIHQWPGLCIPFLPLLGPATWVFRFFPFHTCVLNASVLRPGLGICCWMLSAILFYYFTDLLIYYYFILLFYYFVPWEGEWELEVRGWDVKGSFPF